MFRKTTGTILCPSCGRLTSAEAAACLVCGRRNPGMWGFAAPLRALFGRHSFTNVVTVACIALYVASLLLDPRAAASARGPFDAFSPSDGAHAGGFAGGLLAGLVVSLAERRRETALDWVLAAACIAVTIAGFVLSLWSAFAG